MCMGKKCLGKNETNKLNFVERKWHRKSDIINHVDEIYFSLPTLLQIYTQAHHGKCVKIDVWSLFQSCEKEIKKKIQSITLKKIEISCQPQGYSRAFYTHAVRFCPLFSSPPWVIWQLKSPLKWLEGSWAQLELTDAWCNILMIHSISVVAIRTVWVLILNFVTHLL